MSNHAKSTWTAVETPEIFLTVSRMREEAFVLAFKVYKKIKLYLLSLCNKDKLFILISRIISYSLK